MLVSKKPHEPDANHRGPNMNRCNIVHVIFARTEFALGMQISCSLSRFCSPWVPKTIAVSGGIWTKDLFKTYFRQSFRIFKTYRQSAGINVLVCKNIED